MASNTPKAMSSRLMTMKFMQRGAAKAASGFSSPSTPTGPLSSKRVRLSNGGHTPGTPSDHEVIQAALAAEEKIRQEAVDKASAKAGETKWVLSYKEEDERRPGLQVVEKGFAYIDAEESDDNEEESRPARLQFGGGVPREKSAHADDEQDSEEEMSSDSDDYNSDDPTSDLIREAKYLAAKKEREAKKARKREREAEDTPTRTSINEDRDLGGLSSLSGQRRGGLSGSGLSNMECYNCHEKGHRSSDCPKNSRGGAPRGMSGRGRSGGRGERSGGRGGRR